MQFGTVPTGCSRETVHGTQKSVVVAQEHRYFLSLLIWYMYMYVLDVRVYNYTYVELVQINVV